MATRQNGSKQRKSRQSSPHVAADKKLAIAIAEVAAAIRRVYPDVTDARLNIDLPSGPLSLPVMIEEVWR